MTIPAGFVGFYSSCISFYIRGDDLEEMAESIVLTFQPLSELDRVYYSNGEEEAVLYIIDNDGKKIGDVGKGFEQRVARPIQGGALQGGQGGSRPPQLELRGGALSPKLQPIDYN